MNWNLEPIVHCEIYWWNQQYFLEILLTTQTFKPEGTWSKENICRVSAAGCLLVKSRQQNQAHFCQFWTLQIFKDQGVAPKPPNLIFLLCWAYSRQFAPANWILNICALLIRSSEDICALMRKSITLSSSCRASQVSDGEKVPLWTCRERKVGTEAVSSRF